MGKNLWGEIEEIDVKTPYSILMEQASFIRDKTRGLLFGHVEKDVNDQTIILEFVKSIRVNFTLRLYIVVPCLNNYQYLVARVVQNMAEAYPVYIEQENGYIECLDESSFEENLGNILSSSKVKKVISGLLNQVRSEQSVEA